MADKDSQSHIEGQWNTSMGYFRNLDVQGKILVEQEISAYAMYILVGLMTVKAERDNNNRSLYQDAPPVM